MPRRSRRPAAGAARDSHLPPARDPLARVVDLVVAEQQWALLAHDPADLVEDDPDLLLGPGRRAGLDGVPQGADVRAPDHAGGHTLRCEPAHEGGLRLLLGERNAGLVETETSGHPVLELLHLRSE